MSPQSSNPSLLTKGEGVDAWSRIIIIKSWQLKIFKNKLMNGLANLKKKYSEADKEIADEIADIIFDLTCLANSLNNIDLDKALQRTINKKYKRDNQRFERK